MWGLYTCTDVTTAEGVPDWDLCSLHPYCEDSGSLMVILEIFQECDVNWERSEDENVLMLRFCRGVGLSYVALLGVDSAF